MHNLLERFIARLCDSLGSSDINSILTGGYFEINEVLFCIRSDAEKNGNSVLLYADCGLVEEKGTEHVLAEILKVNFLSFSLHKPSFCISAENGHLICMREIDLALNAESQIHMVIEMANIAVQYQTIVKTKNPSVIQVSAYGCP